MSKEMHHIDNIKLETDSMNLNIDMSRINRNLNKAQFSLDSAVMTSMVPFMPMEDGTFINETRARSAALAGSGEVCAAASPQGRFLYEGKKMVDAETGKGPMRFMSKYGEATYRFRKGAKLKATDKPLQYTKTKHPKAQSHWFDAAKKADSNSWVRVVKNEISKP